MTGKKYELRYLPLFQQDLTEAVTYIADVLKNPYAALKLVDDVEKSIFERLNNPISFETYISAKKRKHKYYRIYVHNYIVYYVVIGNIMEVRRFLYGARDTKKLL